MLPAMDHVNRGNGLIGGVPGTEDEQNGVSSKRKRRT